MRVDYRAFMQEFRDWPSERAFRVRDQLAETIESPGWGTLRDVIEQYREKRWAILEQHGCKDHAAYERAMGQLQGLAAFDAVIEAVFAHADSVQKELAARAAGEEALNGR